MMELALSTDWFSWFEWSSILTALLYIAAIVCFIVGIVGCILPYPGHLFVIGGCVLWALAYGDPYPGVWLWIILSLLALLGSFADNIFTLLGAKYYGCSKAAICCSILGILIGILFAPWGLFLGPFLGALAGELLITRRNMKTSFKSAFGTLLGTIVGWAAKFVIAGIMILVFYYPYVCG